MKRLKTLNGLILFVHCRISLFIWTICKHANLCHDSDWFFPCSISDLSAIMSEEIRRRGKEPAPESETDDANANFSSNVNSNNSENVLDSLVILEFSVRVPPPSIQWILDKIKLVKSKGGSELSACPIVDENHEVHSLRSS